MADAQLEADAALARRLHEEEPLRRQRSSGLQGVENPGARQVRVNMLQDGVRTAVGPQSGAALGAALVFHVPQLIAIVYVLATTADEPSCDRPLRVWAALDGVWIAATMMINVNAYHHRGLLVHEMPSMGRSVALLKQPIDLFGFIWFIVGNIWVFNSSGCSTASPIVYTLCLWLVLANYLALLFPCLLLLLLLPLVFFCLPCIIRMLQRFNDDRNKGATDSQINRLESVTYRRGETEGSEEDATCAICICDFEDGDKLRKLPCTHLFHQACIDDWLRINASCPKCRSAAFDQGEGGGEGAGAAQAPAVRRGYRAVDAPV